MRISPVASLLPVLLVAACGTPTRTSPTYIPPLTAYPTGPVAAQTLPPPIVMSPTEGSVAPVVTTPNTEVAALPDAASAGEVRKADLVGGWTLASAGESCQLSLNLTTWTGGYKASTRGCVSDELKAVTAWDIADKSVLLKDASGSVVARLYSTAPARYSGQTDVTKRGVQFFRG
jgi:hypothetical protein